MPLLPLDRRGRIVSFGLWLLFLDALLNLAIWGKAPNYPIIAGLLGWYPALAGLGWLILWIARHTSPTT